MLKILQKQLKPLLLKSKGYIKGPYANWGEALKASKGYQDPAILEKICSSSLKMLQDERLFARDGMIFTTPQYVYPVFCMLLKIAIEKNNSLQVLDVGGSLGTTYLSFKRLCPNKVNLRWHIVEQNSYVECGNRLFKNEELSFSIDYGGFHPDVVLFSATLSYLEFPYEMLKKIIALHVPYLILDRTLFDMNAASDKILVEHVREDLYKSSYPFWLFSYLKLKTFLDDHYHCMDEFEALEKSYSLNGFEISSKGFILRRKR